MKKIISSVFVAAAFFSALSVKAQTADEIVNKSIDAIGGKDAISKTTSLTMTGTVQAFGGDNPTTVTILNGKGYKSESEFNGQKVIQCINEKGGWAVSPMGGGGAQEIPEEAYKASKSQLDIGGGLYNYAAKGSTAELLGKEGSAYKIKLTTKDKDVTTYFIDATTYYVSKIVKKGNVMGQDVEISIQFSDYKKTDSGLLIPFTTNTDLGQFQIATTFTKVEVNKTVDPAIFAMPK